jgi:hypothetical protein
MDSLITTAIITTPDFMATVDTPVRTPIPGLIHSGP